jgi:hypothetical protein
MMHLLRNAIIIISRFFCVTFFKGVAWFAKITEISAKILQQYVIKLAAEKPRTMNLSKCWGKYY